MSVFWQKVKFFTFQGPALLTNLKNLCCHSLVIELHNFQFKGFKPDKTVKNKVRFVYSFIESHAPSDSRKTASLTKQKTKNGAFYEARLKLSSAGVCSFEICSKRDKITDSIEALQQKFLDKIISWNKARKLITQQKSSV